MLDISQIRTGDRVLVGGHLVSLTAEFVSSLTTGDSLVASEASGKIMRIPAEIKQAVETAVSSSLKAFNQLASCSPEQITQFFAIAGSLLSSDDVFADIARANAQDVADARLRHRSVTRLEMNSAMRHDMIRAFEMWRDLPLEPLTLESAIEHQGFTVEQWRAPLGVIGFVFEGRPNVFADATGVLKSGNCVVFRIGSDALETAKSIMRNVISPALTQSGLPLDSVCLLPIKDHEASWALFSDSRLALAVARGSGDVVRELGSVAKQSGVPVSLHGTGGAWIVVGEHRDQKRLLHAVEFSLDRKVCNTVNVVCVLASNASIDVPIVLEAATRAGLVRGTKPRVHSVNGAIDYIDNNQIIDVVRANGTVKEKQVTLASYEILSHEFEWEETPEFTIVIVDSVAEALELFNSYSPQFVISGITESQGEAEEIWLQSNSPFMGNGFTRWVDGQFALSRPELGLSNWEFGRLFGRGGVLSGDSCFTVRLRVHQSDPQLHR